MLFGLKISVLPDLRSRLAFTNPSCFKISHLPNEECSEAWQGFGLSLYQDIVSGHTNSSLSLPFLRVITFRRTSVVRVR